MIETTTLNVIGLLKCVIKKLSYDLASELVENKPIIIIKPITIEEIVTFMIDKKIPMKGGQGQMHLGF